MVSRESMNQKKPKDDTEGSFSKKHIKTLPANFISLDNSDLPHPKHLFRKYIYIVIKIIFIILNFKEPVTSLMIFIMVKKRKLFPVSVGVYRVYLNFCKVNCQIE